MKSKRKEIQKYNVGGLLQAGMGVAQTAYGLSQMPRARAEFERAKAAAPSLETPAQYYENYKNAYDSELARMQDDMIQRNLATSVQALQGAGGRALVGGLSGAMSQGQAAQMQMLAQERAARMQAGQQLAAAEERTIGRKEQRSAADIAMANQAYQSALGNVGAGIGAIGTGLMYGLKDFDFSKAVDNETPILDDVQTSPNAFGPPAPPQTGVDDALTQNILEYGVGADGQRNYGDTELRDASTKTPSNPMMKEAWADQWYERNYGVSRNVDFNKEPFSPFLPQVSKNDGQFPNIYGSYDDYLSQFVPMGKEEDLDMESLPPSVGGYLTIGGQVYKRPDNASLRFERKMKDLNQNVLTGYGMQSTVGFLKKHGGMMTNGEFNHATNPIDIVQNGQKIGEATGNEYILNPTQASKIAKESSFARKLFKSFERKAKKNK